VAPQEKRKALCPSLNEDLDCNHMTPTQDAAWDKWMEAEYSGLYWQYSAARLGKIVTAVNIISALTGASAVTLLIADYPVLTKVIALLASALTLFASYSGLQPDYEKAKIRADLYSKISAGYERLWNRVNQGLDDESISKDLEVLLDQETLVPTAPDQKYDDSLRERTYKMLVESKRMASGTPA
jgi:hypothetical protein